MNIRQAAKWAEQKDCLFRVDYKGQPDYMYAVWRYRDHEVVCLGYHAKCNAYILAHKGDSIRMDALEEILQNMAESEGEAACLPDACEIREWA